ncbi:MAG: hypothetical protein DI586_05360 [Micavibrio aeruginosavorus]|uniref:Protein kinase domain-containing protein n=1 Tax=Micavibrio aeruginosavorus TaxID=349221 RepID=A0A2W5FPY4_9BACT|nr:MAG: hypothetical protein DI586_05360 [Micavibrio aeruginosavorus]
MSETPNLTEPPKAEPAPQNSAVGANPVLLKGEIEIYPDQRLPHLDQGPVKAYAATGRAKEKAYALLVEKPLVPQIHASSKYMTLNTPSLPRLMATGTVNWVPEKQQRYVFVYENKLGLPFANPSNFTAMGLKADNVLHGFVKKMVPLLKNFRDMDFVHGNIRVTNLFTGGGNGFEKIMLGECLATPPAYLYSSVYEPIERAAALPLGRGTPDYADDLYSFGAMLAIMIRTSDPTSGWSDESITEYKIEHGSYQALTGKERFSGSILELLRGLLNDDVKQRWTIEDILTWVDGQRVSPKQAGPVKPKAARPIDFFGEKFLRPNILALNLHKNPTDVVRINDHGELKLWLNRSIQDKKLEENVEHASNAAKELGVMGEAYPERIAGFMSAVLGPGLPVFYRGLKFHPEAFGRMLAEAYVTKKDLAHFAEVLQTSLVNFWALMNDTLTPHGVEIVSKFDTCKAFLRQQGQGYGLERCLYYLCSEAPCMSEKLKNYYVRTPEELVTAYESLAATPDRPEGFFDRHIVAFLSVKDRSVVDPYIPDINSNDPTRSILAALRVFSSIQRRGKMQNLPNILNWIAEKVDPLINRFHDRDQRAKLKAQLIKIKDKGDISAVEQLFDNLQALQADEHNFNQASYHYNALTEEHAKLEHDLAYDDKFGHATGQSTSALISGIVATCIIIVYLFYKFTTKTAF